MQLILEKKRVYLSKGQYTKLVFLAKLERLLARLKNRIAQRKCYFLAITQPYIRLNTKGAEWKIEADTSLVCPEPWLEWTPAEYVYGERENAQLIATVSVCDNPRSIDLEKLEKEFPEAYKACLRPKAKHLRFLIK